MAMRRGLCGDDLFARYEALALHALSQFGILQATTQSNTYSGSALFPTIDAALEVEMDVRADIAPRRKFLSPEAVEAFVLTAQPGIASWFNLQI